MLLLFDEHALMPFRQSGAVPHGTYRILQSFHSGSGCKLRLPDRNVEDFSWCIRGILPMGPGGRSWITCHCQVNVSLFDIEATAEVVRKCVILIWVKTGCIIHWVPFQCSEGDGCWFLKTRNRPWSIFNFEYCFAECAWNISVRSENLISKLEFLLKVAVDFMQSFTRFQPGGGTTEKIIVLLYPLGSMNSIQADFEVSFNEGGVLSCQWYYESKWDSHRNH